MLQAVALPAEQEDEKKKKRDKEDNNTGHDDWTTTKGGFIPNILKRKRSSRPKIHTVDNIQDYKTVVADEEEQIVVVRFFANWCRSCKATKPHFNKLVNSYSDDSVKFVEVPLTKETAYLQQGLDVPSVPFVHIYHPEAGLVEEMKASKPHFSEFRKRLNSYVVGSCDIPDEVDDIQPMGSFE
jgi:thiol-disulfide isomerase/thioredoxin